MISGNLEYLMSSLPNLSFTNNNEFKQELYDLFEKYQGNGAAPLNPIAILDHEAQKFLSATTLSLFQGIDLKNIHEEQFQNSKARVLSRFSKSIYQLKQEIRAWRMASADHDKGPQEKRVKTIIGEGNPLEQEVQIMKYQWDILEELSIGHFADIEALLVYKLKLMLLLRWWSFHTEKGMDHFIKLTKST
jgi:hypothetical protein